MDLLFPPKCPLCEEPLPLRERGKKKMRQRREGMEGEREGFCKECESKVEYAGMVYDAKADSTSHGPKHSFEAAYAVFKYASIAKAVYHLKYQGKVEYGRTLGKIMWQKASSVLKEWEPDCILPVPLHENRKKKRGFNQSKVLSEALSEGLGIPIFPEMVLRCRDTKPMRNLNARERQNNLKKAFKIGQNDVKLKTILIVDDIYTTGATTDEISRLLLEAGASKTYVLTLGSDTEDVSAW